MAFPLRGQTGGVLADYVNTWLNIKQESAGWPDDCQTQEAKDAHIQAHKQREGIKLGNVAKKPGEKNGHQA